jgi:hypothetical protein
MAARPAWRREERITDFLPVGWFQVPNSGMPAFRSSWPLLQGSIIYKKNTSTKNPMIRGIFSGPLAWLRAKMQHDVSFY